MGNQGPQEPSQRKSAAQAKDSAFLIWSCRIALGLATLVILLPAVGWFNGLPPLGDDSSSHITLMARIAEVLDTGAGWWAPDYNLGFPITLYYQPLPHLVGGILTFLAGGGAAAIGVYKALGVILSALAPWAMAFGARRLGISRVGATAAGMAAPLVESVLGFGLTPHSSLILGLHTQAWAAVILPIALGEMGYALRYRPGQKSNLTWAILAWVVLCLSHFFYGIALGAIVAGWLLLQPLRHLFFRALARLSWIGFATGICLLFWVVPMFTTQSSMGGWPFGNPTRVNGYGFEAFLQPLLDGALLDGAADGRGTSLAEQLGGFGGMLGGLPILTWLSLLGLVMALWHGVVLELVRLTGLVLGDPSTDSSTARSRRHTARLLLWGLAISALFTIGRTGLGSVVDLFPFNRSVQMFRYLGVFHLFSFWLLGFGIASLGRGIGAALRSLNHTGAQFLSHPVAIGLLALPVVTVMIGPFHRGLSNYYTAFRTVDAAGLDFDSYSELVDAMTVQARRTGARRFYAHPNSGVRGHYHSGLLGLWNASDAGQSYGVGLHDSLNFYFLEFFHPERNNYPERVDLYGFQYIVGDGYRDFGHVADAVYESNDYTLWMVDHHVSMCEAITVAGRFEGYPREMRRLARRWLVGNGPGDRVHDLYDVPTALNFSDATGAPVTVEGSRNVPAPQNPVGWVLLDQTAPDRLACRVYMREAGAVLFKVGYHPFWRATVDGSPADTTYAVPAFNAVELGPGLHEVVLSYETPRYIPYLLWLAAFPLVLTWFFERWRRQASRVGEVLPRERTRRMRDGERRVRKKPTLNTYSVDKSPGPR